MMKARISDELENSINEKIMLDLEIHVINRKLVDAERTGSSSLSILTALYQARHKLLAELNQYLRKEQVKVESPVRRNDIFIDYHFSVKVDGGYKRGTLSYWDIVLKQRTQQRINEALEKLTTI